MSKFSLTDHPVLQLHTVAVADPPLSQAQTHRHTDLELEQDVGSEMPSIASQEEACCTL